MAGLKKQKLYDWKDSNMEFIGSKEDRQVKKESAQNEPAWKNVGKEVGLQIWRIVNFEVTPWPKEEYGKFYNGDSYIVLNTHGSQPFQYDVHFWIGSKSSQDEYTTAAYKTVELDNYVDDAAIQHREVEGFESDLFKSYFNSITILQGGANSGFRFVSPTEYKPRLLHFHGDSKPITLNEVPLHPNRVKSGDVYILDLGLMLYQWNGDQSSKDERVHAMQFLINLKNERGGKCQSEVLEEHNTSKEHDFFKSLTAEDKDISPPKQLNSTSLLLKVSDEGGSLQSSKIKDGKISSSDFKSEDVFIFDNGKDCFVWVGKKSSPGEKQNGLTYAHNHLMKSNHPLIPVHVIKEGQKNFAFLQAVAA